MVGAQMAQDTSWTRISSSTPWSGEAFVISEMTLVSSRNLTLNPR
jgi:hypothetical protein